jgi:hypothetical protein
MYMESHKIWMANLQDMLLNHVCQGFLKTHAEIVRLCGGYKVKFSIQTAMEGISHLSAHKINSDYRVLLESLSKIGITEKNLSDLITNSYTSYSLTALRSAGIKCDSLDPSLLNGPYGGAFIHEVYINVARSLWMRPDVLIDQNVPQLKLFVREGVEQAVRSGVNLNQLIAALNGLERPPVYPAPAKPSIRDRMNMLNRGKTLLDDSDDDEETMASIAATPVKKTGGGSYPSRNIPDLDLGRIGRSASELTIDDDDLAPDNMTITFNPSERSEERAPPAVLKSGSSSNGSGAHNDADNYEKFTVEDNRSSSSTIIDVKLEGDAKASGSGSGSDVDIDDLVAGEIVFDIEPRSSRSKFTTKPITAIDIDMISNATSATLSSRSRRSKVDVGVGDVGVPKGISVGGMPANSDMFSAYTVSLLSHNDMLSSRLSRLGTQ